MQKMDTDIRKEEYRKRAIESFISTAFVAFIGPFCYVMLIINVEGIYWMSNSIMINLNEIIFSNTLNRSYQAIIVVFTICFLIFMARRRDAGMNLFKVVRVPVLIVLSLVISNLSSQFFRQANASLVFLILSTISVPIFFIYALVVYSKSLDD